MESNALRHEVLAATVQVRHLMTPIDRAVAFAPNASQSVVAEKLTELAFDYAPVVDGDGTVLGRVGLAEIDPQSRQAIAGRYRHLAPELLIGASAAVTDLIQWLSLEPWLFVVERRGVDGLVTPSDLNKHSARTYFFLLVSGLEAELAAAIRRAFPDPEDAVARLSRTAQRNIRRRFDALRVEDLDVDIVASLTLAELLRIAATHEEVRGVFGFPSKTSFANATGGFVAFRNQVAHPSRAVLSDRAGLDTLKRRATALQSILDRAADHQHKL